MIGKQWTFSTVRGAMDVPTQKCATLIGVSSGWLHHSETLLDVAGYENDDQEWPAWVSRFCMHGWRAVKAKQASPFDAWRDGEVESWAASLALALRAAALDLAVRGELVSVVALGATGEQLLAWGRARYRVHVGTAPSVIHDLQTTAPGVFAGLVRDGAREAGWVMDICTILKTWRGRGR